LQALMCFVRVNEFAGNLAAMELAAVGTGGSQTWAAIGAI
jgi:hypothetical protein